MLSKSIPGWCLLGLLVSSVHLHAVNEKKTKQGDWSGTWVETKTQNIDYTVVSVSVTHTISKEITTTITTTETCTASTAPSVAASISASVAVKGGVVSSTTTNKEWKDGDTQPSTITGEKSSKAWSAYRPESGWVFKSWIKGPPPTDEEDGQPIVTTTVVSDELKIKTTKTNNSWSLSWLEVEN
jgi:hypothetical protein